MLKLSNHLKPILHLVKDTPDFKKIQAEEFQTFCVGDDLVRHRVVESYQSKALCECGKTVDFRIVYRGHLEFLTYETTCPGCESE